MRLCPEYGPAEMRVRGSTGKKPVSDLVRHERKTWRVNKNCRYEKSAPDQ